MSLGGSFRLFTANAELAGDAAAIAADAAHVFEAEGLIAFLFIEPEGRTGRALAKALFSGAELASVPLDLISEFRTRAIEIASGEHFDKAALIAAGQGLIARLSGNAFAPVPDVRVRKIIAWAATRREPRVSLSEAGAIAGLSAGRLRHLFVEETGLPFKTYVLWLRLMRAVEVIAAGASLTEAAHAACFSDLAHFSRTFRRMFGVSPAAIAIS